MTGAEHGGGRAVGLALVGMDGTMHDTIAPEYRIAVPPSRALRRAQARQLIERESHTLVCEVTKDGYANDPAFHWLGDLRRGQLRIYGGLLRFIDTCARRKVAKAVVDMIPEFLRYYIDDAYDNDPPTPSARRAA